jgi:hypothetical protein
MEPWMRTVDVHKWRRGGSKWSRAVTADLCHFDEEQNPDPHQTDADPQLCYFAISYLFYRYITRPSNGKGRVARDIKL